jgi:hypothetical protein
LTHFEKKSPWTHMNLEFDVYTILFSQSAQIENGQFLVSRNYRFNP